MGGFDPISYLLAKRALRVEELKSALGEVFDIHSYCGVRVYFEGVDLHFLVDAWRQNYSIQETWRRVSDFWRDDGIYATKDYSEVIIKSRRAFAYPYVSFMCKMPSLTAEGTKINFGLENDSMHRIGTVQFTYERTGGVNRLYFYIASQWNIVKANIDYAKPSDAETQLYTYAIKVNKGFAEIFINGNLVGVALLGVPSSVGIIDGPPYTIIRNVAPVSQWFPLQIELYPRDKADVLFPLHPANVNAVDGDPCPPRVYDLYLWQSSTKLRGYSIESGSATTHPVPMLGYKDKTIYFMADKDGQLSIEVFTLGGNWREYDSVSVTADRLLAYKMTGDAVLARLVFTPSTYPATVLESEVVLGGG